VQLLLPKNKNLARDFSAVVKPRRVTPREGCLLRKLRDAKRPAVEVLVVRTARTPYEPFITLLAQPPLVRQVRFT